MMNLCLKRIAPLVIALAATGVFANQGESDAAPNNAKTQPTVGNQPAVGNAGRIALYEYPNFAGPRVTIDNGMARNLDWANFNNPLHSAASVKVDSGNWKVCSQPAFQGDCRVIGPGEYPQISATGIASAEPVLSPQLGLATTR